MSSYTICLLYTADKELFHSSGSHFYTPIPSVWADHSHQLHPWQSEFHQSELFIQFLPLKSSKPWSSLFNYPPVDSLSPYSLSMGRFCWHYPCWSFLYLYSPRRISHHPDLHWHRDTLMEEMIFFFFKWRWEWYLQRNWINDIFFFQRHFSTFLCSANLTKNERMFQKLKFLVVSLPTFIIQLHKQILSESCSSPSLK